MYHMLVETLLANIDYHKIPGDMATVIIKRNGDDSRCVRDRSGLSCHLADSPAVSVV